MLTSAEKAELLLENGLAHGLAATVLFTGSLDYGRKIGVEEEKLDKYAFNGTCSLSVHYLVGLGLELLLKAAYVASSGEADDDHLRSKIGHDLHKAFNRARQAGIESGSEHLEDLVGYMNEPYKHHHLRYGRPDGMNLPDNMDQVAAVFETLGAEVREKL